MTPLVYNLEISEIHVHAVITWDGRRGRLLVCYDERSVTIPLGSQVQYLRVDAMRALTSARSLADMAGQLTYSQKATCRAIANRLDRLVAEGRLTDNEAQGVLTEIKAKWNTLQTAHDFARFVSTNEVARRHLDRCARNDEDFARIIAPRLAEVIKMEEKDGRAAAATVEAQVRVIERTLGGMTAALKGLLQRHERPVGETAADLLEGVGGLVTDLRAQADATLQAGAVDALIGRALQKRGVEVLPSFGPVLKARALVEYLSAVEAAAEAWQGSGKKWQCFAGTMVQTREDLAVLRTSMDDAVRMAAGKVRRMLAGAADQKPEVAVVVEKDTDFSSTFHFDAEGRCQHTYTRSPAESIVVTPMAAKVHTEEPWPAAGEEVTTPKAKVSDTCYVSTDEWKA